MLINTLLEFLVRIIEMKIIIKINDVNVPNISIPLKLKIK